MFENKEPKIRYSNERFVKPNDLQNLLLDELFENFEQPELFSSRFILEPITESHKVELYQFFNDLELYHFVPLDPPTLEQLEKRCSRWITRRSPDGEELWLNWAARDNQNREIVAHIQGGLTRDRIASIGYIVGQKFQKKGVATECLEAVFLYLDKVLQVKEIRAWSDTRNKASHKVAKKLGMVQVELIKSADFFKGITSDEYVFSKVFRK
ncbi:MAG: GNAT family N-acetyltransferase [Deltaproteobacteria bacterium]|nr:GNAT family N-acetyltransferase [Deltaproteobacteria bacterium]